MRRHRVLAAGAALLAAPAVAYAAAPANDAPGGAAEFEAFTAGNLPDGETAAEQQGVADLSEATADKGVARCLGRLSFAKTVWFKIPASDAPQHVRIEASSPSGGTSEVPDLALYASARPRLAQACDGPAAGERSSSAAGVEARLRAGVSGLVQVGRSAGQSEAAVVASLRTTPIEAAGKAPAGDVARKAPRAAIGTTGRVTLGGATLTAEDPAQPACPAAATVWRRTAITRAGRHRVVVRGGAAGSVTAFVGARPTADNAKACANRRTATGAIALTLRVKRGQTLWTRIGADAPAAGAKAKLRVKRLK